MTRTLTMLLTAAALALGVAACGDDEDSASSGASATPTATPEPMQASQDIVGVAQGEQSLSTLVRAVTAADLATTLKGEGPYTVFAPTNQAFGAVPKDTLNQLLRPAGKQQLTQLLTYHVVEGNVPAGDLRDGQQIKTIQGGELTVSKQGDMVKIGDATVVQPDVDASNGTVHVIDTVLQPAA